MKQFDTFEEKLNHLKEYPEKMKFALEELYQEYPEMAEKFVNLAVIGKHLTEDMLEKAINGMEFSGSVTPWTINQTNDVAKSLGIIFEKFNQYDFNFMMNWYLSDMAEVWGTDAIKYGKYSYYMLTNDPDNECPSERAYEVAKRFIERYEAE